MDEKCYHLCILNDVNICKKMARSGNVQRLENIMLYVLGLEMLVHDTCAGGAKGSPIEAKGSLG